jgi:hypothetical protein
VLVALDSDFPTALLALDLGHGCTGRGLATR